MFCYLGPKTILVRSTKLLYFYAMTRDTMVLWPWLLTPSVFSVSTRRNEQNWTTVFTLWHLLNRKVLPTLQHYKKKYPHPHVAPTLLKQVIVYSATNVRDFSANLLSKYGLCIYSLILRKKVWGRLPPTILAWDQTISPCVGAQRQGSQALHHLADTGKSR